MLIKFSIKYDDLKIIFGLNSLIYFIRYYYLFLFIRVIKKFFNSNFSSKNI